MSGLAIVLIVVGWAAGVIFALALATIGARSDEQHRREGRLP